MYIYINWLERAILLLQRVIKRGVRIVRPYGRRKVST